MKDKIKVILLSVVFIALLFGSNYLLKSQNADIGTKQLLEENTTNNNEQEESFSLKVTEANFEKEVLNSEKTVLIDFYADWCGPCKRLAPIVEDVAKENPNLKVVKIDVDNNPSLAYKYNATSIPTLVVIKNGEEVNRAVGLVSKETILDLVK